MGVDITVFYLAIAVICNLFVSNILYTIYAKVFGMRLESFEISTRIFGKHLMYFKRNNIRYILGYLPINASVRVAGMSKDDLEFENREIEDDMYLGKPISSRVMFRILPIITTIILVFVCIVFINLDNTFTDNFQIAKTAVLNMYDYLSENINAEMSIATWNSLTKIHNEFFIILMMLLLMNVIFAITTPIIIFLIQNPKTYHVIITFVLQVLIYGYILYKLGILFTNLHTFSEGFMALVVFFGTAYMISYVVFLGIKTFPKNWV
ncbi:hypothetical protein EZY14_018290 [Kordia sp. TARA_039_SRF]|nr:hypothetical protein EZY14_018290 [Kordia sp. TARA_039_SRF]